MNLQIPGRNQGLVLTLDMDRLQVVKWYVDVYFAVHRTIHSHNRIMMTLGKGCMFGSSGNQKLNKNSSTKSELVGVRDTLLQVLCTRYFLKPQGYDIWESLIYQDNQSTMLIYNNVCGSSRNITHHINMRYFFITNVGKSKEESIKYSPTDEVIFDFFRKSLQVSKSIEFRNLILNIQY